MKSLININVIMRYQSAHIVKSLLLSIVAISLSYSQESLSNYHLGNIPLLYQYNPAEYNDANVTIASPALIITPQIDFSYNDFLSLGSVITTENGKNTININSLSNNISDAGNSRIGVNTNINLLYVGIRNRKKNSHYRFFVDAKSTASLHYPASLISMAAEGWGADNLGKEFHEKMKFYYQSHIEVGFGYTQELKETGFTVGGNIKYLMGLNYGLSEDIGLSFKSNEDNYSLTILQSDGGKAVGNFQSAFSEEYGYSDDTAEDLQKIKGHGAAIDLGVTYDFNVKYEIPLIAKLSVNDLGFIMWKDLFTYQGKNKEYLIDNLTKLDDVKLTDFIDKESLSFTSPTTFTSPKIVLSGTYSIGKLHHFNFTMLNRFDPINIQNIIAAGYTIKLFEDRLAFTVNGIKLPQNKFSVGVGTRAKLGPLLFQLSTDTATSVLNVINASALNANFGIALIFGNGRKNKAKQEATNNLIVSPRYIGN